MSDYEMRQYLREKDVPVLVDDLIRELVQKRPDDVKKFLATSLLEKLGESERAAVTHAVAKPDKPQTQPKRAARPLRIAVISGSVRPDFPAMGPWSRFGSVVAKWFSRFCEGCGHTVLLVDPKEYPLPLLRKPLHHRKPEEIPAGSDLVRLGELLASADAIVLVTAEYNCAPPPALLNLLDHFPPNGPHYASKAFGILSYAARPTQGKLAAYALHTHVSELGGVLAPVLVGLGQVGDILDHATATLKDQSEDWGGRLQKFVSEIEYVTEIIRPAKPHPAPNSLHVAVILGSVRDGRYAAGVGAFVSRAIEHLGHRATPLDPLELDLPMLELALTHYANVGKQAPQGMQILADVLERADAIIVISGEYNHAPPPALLNLLDCIPPNGSQFRRKPAALVTYGGAQSAGGRHAAVCLRTVLVELGCLVAPLDLSIPSVWTEFTPEGKQISSEDWQGRLGKVLDGLLHLAAGVRAHGKE
eukprot:TRINITY_DN3314_c0_g1_i1.p1 TRINITY_DN3314_c0_g1~~TRINITY_DN3314_c0_g1_i1.p1  ORF type:complete len:475 (-),score=76.07 TRINITY_DN3314_c0_g1_i1:306-1730(-)